MGLRRETFFFHVYPSVAESTKQLYLPDETHKRSGTKESIPSGPPHNVPSHFQQQPDFPSETVT